jgi:polyisoprenoid-binding protein YceI
MNKIAYAVLLATVISIPARADWALNSDQSALSFVSTKATNVAEAHKFTDLSGSVDAHGEVNIAIGLASVNTGIELRDERMREMLFNTAEYTAAGVSAKVDMASLDKIAVGQSVDLMLEGMLTLHGEARPLMMDVVVARAGDSRLLVISKKPVVVNATEFGLAEGVEALREIAGLPSISLAVPVSFVLAFDKR